MELKIDYVTINFDKGCADIDSISHALSGDDLFFHQKRSSDNALYTSPFGLSYLHNSGWDPRPHRLQVSGVGCRHFEPTLLNLKNLAVSNGGDIAISRIDFAFDVPIKKENWKKYIASAFSSSLFSDRQRKKYTIAGSGESMTIYIGSRLSDAYFRIYNKTLESKNTYVLTENGNEVPVSDDEYVIRFEVELKRHVHHHGSECVVFDPTPLFYQYYSQDEQLLDYVKELWLEYGNSDILLPCFDDLDLHYSEQNFYFASISASAAINVVQDKLYDEPKTFSSTLNYVVSHFGKYLPFIYSDEYFIRDCELACKEYCGFIPEYPIDLLIHNDLKEIEDDMEPDDPFYQYTFYPEVTNES